MNRRRRLALLLALFASMLPQMSSQVVQLSGYGSSVSGTSGASLIRYDENALSRVSLGAAQGLHLGVSREVTSGAAHLVLGDSRPSLALPTDLQEGDRNVYATGALLQLGSGDRHAEIFVGRSGQNFGNAYFSSVSGEEPLLLSSATMRTGRVLWHSLMVRGERHATLGSAQLRLSARTLVALSAGVCAGRPVLRAGFHHDAPTWQVDISDTSGHLQLQPQRRLQFAQLERIGLNISASKRLGQAVTVDAARHEYATGMMDLPDSPELSTTGTRSVLLEAGVTAHYGPLHSGVRLLSSSSGSVRDHATVWIESWHQGPFSAQAMVLRRTDLEGATTTTLQLDAGRSVGRHVEMRSGMQLGNGAPHADVGGTLKGDWGSFSVSHGESYIPFGAQTGFRRVLTVALRLHVRNAEVGVARSSVTGLADAWDGSLTDFEGAGESDSSGPPAAHISLPKYRLEGIVTDGSRPVAGAAVAVGSQLVYTDSEGRWLARFTRRTPVRVALQPSAFLTDAVFCARSEPRSDTPSRDAVPIALSAEHCRQAPALAALRSNDGATTPSGRSRLRAIAALAFQVVHLWTRSPRT